MNQELHSIATKQSEEMELTQESNDQLHKALQKAQLDILDVGDDAFDKEKAQVLSPHPGVDFSEMDFFKVVMDSRLVGMEEINPSSDDDQAKEDDANGTGLRVINEDNNEE